MLSGWNDAWFFFDLDPGSISPSDADLHAEGDGSLAFGAGFIGFHVFQGR